MLFNVFHRATSRPFFNQALLSLVLASSGWLLHKPAQADTVIETTRIIYPEARRDVSFKITNSSKTTPSFVQM